jgi:hypothetical protein
MTRRSRFGGFAALAALAVLAACSSDVTTVPRNVAPQAVITVPTDPFTSSDNTFAYVCVVSPVAGTYSYDISGAPFGGSGNPGPTLTNDPANLTAGTCEQIAIAGAGAGFADPDAVTADQTAIPAGATLDSVHVEDAKYSQQGGTANFLGSDPSSQTDPATGLIANERATKITFFYSQTPTTGGGEGCTPGYWKQEHHFDSWVGYSPDQLFSSVFEDAFPGKTLDDVLGQGGGGLNALGRHTVAALLNASAGLSFPFTTTDVINAFNAVFPGGDYEGQKNIFAAANEKRCPLN